MNLRGWIAVAAAVAVLAASGLIIGRFAAPSARDQAPTVAPPEPVAVDVVMDTSRDLAMVPAEEGPATEAAAEATPVELEAPGAPEPPLQFAEGHASKSLRNRDFPRTYISAIHVSLTSPNHWVELSWTGPHAANMKTGPFRSSPGAGMGYNNCDDFAESNRNESNCTPKGEFAVQGYSDFLPSYPHCQFVTWFNIPRAVAFHSHWDVPRYPASHGCVRLDPHVAQLIHNNTLVEQTKVNVDGTWSRRGQF